MKNEIGYNGIAFPFRFSGGGGVSQSSTNAGDFSHIKEEVIQVLSTNKGERVFDPTYGSEISKTIFNNTDVTSITLLKSYIKDSLKILEDAIEIVDISISDEREGVCLIDIEIYVKKYMKSDKVTVPYNVKQGGIVNG